MRGEKVSPDVIIRRVIKNYPRNMETDPSKPAKPDPSFGDWTKIEKLKKDALAQADEIEKLCKDLIKADKKLKDMILEAYATTPSTDSLFYDSPLAPSRQSLYLRAFLKKLGWEGARDVHMDIDKIQDFSKAIKDGFAWLAKFKNDKNT